MDICIDFDGTCVTHEYPEIGHDIGAVSILKKIVESGHNIILFTMRCDLDKEVEGNGKEIFGSKPRNYLSEAINWFKDNNIPLYGVNRNPHQLNWTTSPKAYGQLYIDDAALGIPLVHDKHERPFVDWIKVEELLKNDGVIK